MAEFKVSAQREDPPYAAVDVWFVNPTCGPSKMKDGCLSYMIGNHLFDFETGHPVKPVIGLAKVLTRGPRKRVR